MALSFPNVPNLPGVPPVPRLPGAIVAPALTIASGAISTLLGQAAKQPNKWGIYASGENTPAIPSDSTLEFSYRQQFDIPDFPVVDGAFASYNKVRRPNEIQVRLSKGKTRHERELFLKAIEEMAAAISLYDIRTPERTYSNYNLAHWEVSRREGNGAYFLTDVDLTFVEIMQTTQQYASTATFHPGVDLYSGGQGLNLDLSNAQSPAALPTVNQGTVQPQNATGNLANIGQRALNTAAAFPNTR